mmetsp:Transcript_36550/g.85789  ORF Transcript_36550/g.85789 Transcript_36550/m.85789 type:complete len:246 (-) Transcript_36550:585-1322(-)
MMDSKSRIWMVASNHLQGRHMLSLRQITNPFLSCSSSTPLIFILMLSPGRASLSSYWSTKICSTVIAVLLGRTISDSPVLMVPASSLPMTHVPMSLYLSAIGKRSGMSKKRAWGWSWSKKSRSEGPSYHGHTSGATLTLRLAPVKPEMGMKYTSVLTLKPACLRKGSSCPTTSLYRSWSHTPPSRATEGSSILLMPTMSILTPAVLASTACSLDCPPLSNPASNSPLRTEMTSTATSACEAPPIM